MKYTLLSFHFDRGLLSSERYRDLQVHIDELDRQAAFVSQGIYILRPEQFAEHAHIIQRTDALLRQLGLHYATAPFYADPFPQSWLPDEAHARLTQWDDADPTLQAP